MSQMTPDPADESLGASGSDDAGRVRPEGEQTLTIGVVIAVPEPFATQLRDARRSYGDPQADVIPTHVTILPPTTIERSAMESVHEHLAQVATQTVPFRIELMGTDTFRPVSPVVFLPLVKGASACAALATQVRMGPLERSLDFSYHPHVTVGHNIAEEQLDAAERGSRDVHLEFVADEVVLYLRDTAHNWERCAGFAFEGGFADVESVTESEDPAKA